MSRCKQDRHCWKCGERKPIRHFDGRRYHCKSCQQALLSVTGKRCDACSELKPLSEFYRAPRCALNRQPCKDCYDKRRRANEQSRATETREARQCYYIRNRETLCAKSRKAHSLLDKGLLRDKERSKRATLHRDYCRRRLAELARRLGCDTSHITEDMIDGKRVSLRTERAIRSHVNAVPFFKIIATGATLTGLCQHSK